MVRNSGKGGKGAKKKASKNVEGGGTKFLELKDDEQEYAFLSKSLGNCRFECICQDGTTRLGCIRGGMRKRVWLKVGEWVLVSLRDFQDNKCDIIHKYSESDVNQLKKIGAITGNIETELTMGEDIVNNEYEDDNIILGDDEIDNI